MIGGKKTNVQSENSDKHHRDGVPLQLLNKLERERQAIHHKGLPQMNSISKRDFGRQNTVQILKKSGPKCQIP